MQHSRNYVLAKAKKYGLYHEIKHAMDIYGMTPDEAMLEYDIYLNEQYYGQVFHI